jgi:Ca-activated chloride channel family protein
MLDDYGKAGDNSTEKEVTALGLKYNLLTAYTSFIAIDSEIRNTTGQSVTVKQPLPLPEGVSNYAVGYTSSNKRYTAPATMKSKEYIAEDKTEWTEPELITLNTADVEEDSITDNTVYSTVEQMPVFDGKNIQAFQAYVTNHFVCPETVKNTKIKGRVFVQFVVDETGKVADIKIARGLHPEIDREILWVIKNSPLWTPGLHKGKPVKVRLILPFDIDIK